MYRLSQILIILFSLIAFKANAQMNFKYVDSVSYRLYVDQRWDELTLFGSQANDDGFDYYNLNLRTGIAFYEVKQYEEAVVYFNRSLQNNSASEIGKTYLFWSYIFLNDEVEASKVYKSFQDSTKENIHFKSSQLVNYIFAEGGGKFSNNSEYAGNIRYLNIGLSSKISPSIYLYQAYTFTSQDLI